MQTASRYPRRVEILIETRNDTIIPLAELGSRKSEIADELKRAAKIVAEELTRKNKILR